MPIHLLLRLQETFPVVFNSSAAMPLQFVSPLKHVPSASFINMACFCKKQFNSYA